MWTIKIALLAAGIAVTNFANTSTYAAACANAPETSVEMMTGDNTTAARDTQPECLPRE